MSRIHEALKKAEEERAAQDPAGVSIFDTSDAAAVAAAPAVKPVAAPAAAMPLASAAGASMQPAGLQCSHPQWHPQAGRMLFYEGDTDRSIGTEEFRTLRSRLYRLRQKMPLKTLLVSSALQGEGKSFVSSNLAQVLARQFGRRVLLVDADLRRPSLHRMFGAPETPGLTEYLAGEADEFSILQACPAMENLIFVPGGSLRSNPAELLANGRLGTLVQRLAPSFEWIVFDSSPVVPVSDAVLVSHHCDGVILIVNAGQTPIEVAQRAHKELKDRSVVGVVLNRVHPRDSGYGSYYYYGGYGYGEEPPADAKKQKGKKSRRKS